MDGLLDESGSKSGRREREAAATGGEGCFVGLLARAPDGLSVERRNVQLLAREDLVRVLQRVLVFLEDLGPLVRVAILLLRDLRQAVSGLDLVDLGRGRARAAGDVGEVGDVAHGSALREVPEGARRVTQTGGAR